jgi:hypothetical protein
MAEATTMAVMRSGGVSLWIRKRVSSFVGCLVGHVALLRALRQRCGSLTTGPTNLTVKTSRGMDTAETWKPTRLGFDTVTIATEPDTYDPGSRSPNRSGPACIETAPETASLSVSRRESCTMRPRGQQNKSGPRLAQGATPVDFAQ